MNQLGAETSPYLLQHKDNPVEWRVWGEAALAEARAADKPILLSVGYAACHWCHVMAHESFENPGIAALMNAHFVPIKVDREERPDIDAIYQHALALTGQQGGWPLTMFLTPAGEPFWGGTYFPPENRWGRTGFADVLRGVSATYREEREKVTGNVKLLTEGLQRFSAAAGSAPVELEFIDRLAARLAGGIDKKNGGLGGAPKFPNCPILGLLWRAADRRDEAAWRDPVLLTLDRMSAGGIYDHLGGGYARYSTDERWLAPHFEKMLYDNAQILELLVWAWQATGRPLYATRIADSIGWLLREMRMEGGAFAATIDADSEHVEGKFYVWEEDEIDELLGPDAALFKRHYDVSMQGNWEEANILNRLRDPQWDDVAIDAALAPSREILFRAREGRIRPGLDDKILADWNGLAISALVQAALAFDRPDWLAAAVGAWDFVVATLRREDGRLLHSWCRGRTHPGTLDDHAFMSRAALALYQATGDGAYLKQAVSWVGDLETHFRDREHGGYFFSADDTENLIARIRQATDAAIPSGNGVMVEVLASLWHLTGEARWRDLADSQIAAFSGNLAQQGASLATYLGGVELLRGAVEITIAGPPGRADTEALRRVVLGAHVPNRVLVPWVEGADVPDTHPAFGKTMAGGIAAAYVCRNEVCSAPITDPTVLAKMLAE